MKCIRAHSRGIRRAESGYALLMAVFLVATLLLTASMAVPSVLIEGRRLQEQEVIWRGNQYVRAIRLYYQKNGHFPQSMDDLTKASNNGTYFLRKAYADLLNPDDQGSWRLIYATPAGQLIGSVRYHTLQEMALAMGMPPAQNNALQAAGAAGTAGQQPNGSPSATPTPGQPSDQQGPPAAPGQPNQGVAPSSPFAPGPIGSGPVFGGYLVGVGCKLKRPSLIVYHGGKTYYEWEFIWNPLTVTAVGAPQTGAAPGLAVPNTGALGNSGLFGAPAAPGVPGATGASPSPSGPSTLSPGAGSPTTPPAMPGF